MHGGSENRRPFGNRGGFVVDDVVEAGHAAFNRRKGSLRGNVDGPRMP
jgi:hypothetical protein